MSKLTASQLGLMTSQTQEKPHQERIAGLSELAAECHELAVKRGKYRPGARGPWIPVDGYMQIRNEAREWETEAGCFDVSGDPERRERESEEYGDLLHAVLSVGHERGIDPEVALRGAMARNRARVPREHGGEREP